MSETVPFISKSLIATEAGFEGMIPWPSAGGTLQEAKDQFSKMQGKKRSQLITIGFTTKRVSDDQDWQESEEILITGFLHLISNQDYEAGLNVHCWEKVLEVDSSGRKPGVHYVGYPDCFFDSHLINTKS